jgi:hypothetical protein
MKNKKNMVDTMNFKKCDKKKISFCLGFSIGSNLGFCLSQHDFADSEFWVIYYPYYYYYIIGDMGA